MKCFLVALFVAAVGMATYSFASVKTNPIAADSCGQCDVCDDASCNCADCN